MNKTLIATLITLGLSATISTASANSDLDQIFSEQGKVATLSSQEMQTTEGAFSPLAAQAGFGSEAGEPSEEVLAFLQGLGIDTSTLPEGGFASEDEALAFLQGLGIDTNNLPIGTGFGSETEFLSFLQGQGVDTTGLPIGTGFGEGMNFGSFGGFQ